MYMDTGESFKSFFPHILQPNQYNSKRNVNCFATKINANFLAGFKWD